MQLFSKLEKLRARSNKIKKQLVKFGIVTSNNLQPTGNGFSLF